MTQTHYLIGVVGAGDQQEDPGEGVLGWIGNLPGLGAWMKVTKDTENQLINSIYLLLCLHYGPISNVNILTNDYILN